MAELRLKIVNFSSCFISTKKRLVSDCITLIRLAGNILTFSKIFDQEVG